MAAEPGQSDDLDRTDRLPILEGALVDPDVADDAVRLEAPLEIRDAGEFARRASVDLPSLADSVRSVEERISRLNAEHAEMTRAYENARTSETAATARTAALERDVISARVALESEQNRSREFEKTLAERQIIVETSRSRAEVAVRDAERYQTESRTLRDSLATRDATIVQVLHSLGERDAQLAALQAEHVKILPTLEDQAKHSEELESDLALVRTQVKAISGELKRSQDIAVNLAIQLKRSESEANAFKSDLTQAKTQSGSYLELLNSRDWRSGFNQNLFRDVDAQEGAADAGRAALKSQRDQLQGQLSVLEEKLATQNAAIEKLQSAAAAQSVSHAQQAKEIQQAEQTRAQWAAKLASVDHELTHVRTELAERESSLAEARAGASQHLQRIAELQAEADTREEEMTVLMAHLQESRRPMESIEGDARRLREEVAAKAAAVARLTEEAETLRATLERTRGALEEREFLIRRLERSESNNANALGRIQTSMERLGSVTPAAPPTAGAPEWAPELVRIDGDRSISHALGRRTRIGRAPGCELHIDSSSVSRHHALILAGTREVVIEDLNSTNGVILNGRRVTRQVLSDGDIVTIGDIQFRYAANPASPTP
jgi:chromosome segregation ATPase